MACPLHVSQNPSADAENAAKDGVKTPIAILLILFSGSAAAMIFHRWAILLI